MKVVSECALMAKWSYCKGNLTYVTGWGGGQETGKPEWLLSYASHNAVVIHHIYYRDFLY